VIPINNNHSKWTIETFPNPVKDVLLVQINSSDRGIVKLNLFDQRGKKIIEKQLEKAGDSFDNTIDVSRIAKGTYFLELKVGDGAAEIRKIVKQ
jgi:hypothetical protein